MRETYLRWRDEEFLPKVARLLHDQPTVTREELADLQAQIGALIGSTARGGARTRERWGRCSRKNAATCPTCQATPGHGPYLIRKDGKRWVNVPETDEQRARRRERALREHQTVAMQHALALLAAAHEEASGFLVGEEAERARAEILAALHK